MTFFEFVVLDFRDEGKSNAHTDRQITKRQLLSMAWLPNRFAEVHHGFFLPPLLAGLMPKS
ncbi:hypothetical protein [Allorhodopirellula heiligendammensis]|uniref:Uncharacterized protein n=1 Tax=Allorhodopirellula heiligendammensis TaxID=2714739 RepID=A0A5C6BE75_9BACT|nr:hypothetical protein [Allorhodopirellula heiligendammensis]TWU09947.1 hypothetical protein Poly21_52760 [Allorhodopirellula heiligendammensis]